MKNNLQLIISIVLGVVWTGLAYYNALYWDLVKPPFYVYALEFPLIVANLIFTPLSIIVKDSLISLVIFGLSVIGSVIIGSLIIFLLFRIYNGFFRTTKN